MVFHYRLIPYAWVLFSSTLVSLGILLFTWKRRSVPGAGPAIVLTATSAAWSFFNALEMMGTDLPTKLFWANVQYIFYNVVPIAWLALTLQYIGKERWLTRRRLFLLLIIPVLTVILVWTNPYGLMRRNIYLDSGGPFTARGLGYI